MQVIGSGFGRTGTLSTKHALEHLGFGPCYHMEEVFRRPAHARVWLDVADGADPAEVDWRRLFAEFDSTVDFPASVLWEDLAVAFPDAKVLHTVRDPDRWYDSTVGTIARSNEFAAGWLRRAVPHLDRVLTMTDRLVWQRLFDGRILTDRAHAIAVYEAWTAHVVATVPAERLLVFDVADGWEPLCAFLGVPVPDEPFPNVNDRASMQRRLRALRVVGYAGPALGAGAAAAVARAAFRAQRRRGTSTRTATDSITTP